MISGHWERKTTTTKRQQEQQKTTLEFSYQPKLKKKKKNDREIEVNIVADAKKQNTNKWMDGMLYPFKCDCVKVLDSSKWLEREWINLDF